MTPTAVHPILPPDESTLWDDLDSLVNAVSMLDYLDHAALLVIHGAAVRHAAGKRKVEYEALTALEACGLVEVGSTQAGDLTCRVTERGKFQRQKWHKRLFHNQKRG